MKPEEVQQHNLEVFLERGPGLCTLYKTYIAGRDRERHRVLVGGLGGMGVGQMWFPEEEKHQHYPAYEDAPEMDSEGNMNDWGRNLFHRMYPGK